MDRSSINLEVRKKRWHFTYDRQMSLQRIHLFSFGYRVQLSDFFGVRIDSEIYRIKDGKVAVYYEEDDHKAAFFSVKALFSGPESEQWFQKIQKTIEDGYKTFIPLIEGLPSSYQAVSDLELGKTLSACYRANEAISLPTWLLYLYVEEILADELRERLRSETGSEKVSEDLFEILSRPTDFLPIDAYQWDLYSIALRPENEWNEALDVFARKYGSWGTYDILYPVPDVAFHAEKLEGVTADLAEKGIRSIDAKYESQRKAISENAHYWERNERLKDLVSLYRLYANFKDWKNYYREYSALKMRSLYEEIAKRLDIPLEHAAFLTEQELIDALAGKGIPEASTRESRIRDSSVVVLDGQEYIVTDAEQLLVVDEAVRMKDAVDEVKGTTAFRGTAKGRVIIVTNAGDGDRLKDGDILVASTTRPDYVPFMKRCVAFVTNEGGALSHAAIMARELKIPSVIGTKIATQVFKDGDTVEVNADKGTVTIITRA